MVIFRPATAEATKHVASNLREEDILEMQHYLGGVFNPEVVLEDARKKSWDVFTIHPVSNGRMEDAAAICGTVRLSQEEGPSHAGVWFLATPEIEPVVGSLTREAPCWLDFMAETFLSLHAHAWVGNPHHIRWAKLVGFKQAGFKVFNDQPFILLVR
jgi:hypothetical protein